MKIGVNCYLLQPDIGGIRQYFFNLFNALLEQDRDNEYIFFYFPHNVEELDRLESDRWRESAVFLEHPREIRPHLDTIDLYFCPFNTLSPRPLPIPTVYTIPDIQESYYPHFFSNYLIVARNYHYKASSKMADRIITHSEFTRKSLVRHHGIRPEKVVVAGHCADERFYRAPEIMRPPVAKLPEGYIFYPANHWVHKNHDLLLRALCWLKKERNTEIPLVLTGFDKEGGYPVAESIDKYGLAGQVHLLGYVPVEQLAYVYVHARMLVFPSLFEGFGIPLVEAMATGCPVLAARSTSLPEIGGNAVRYFDPASAEDLGRAIMGLMNDQALRTRLAEKGRERVRRFTADRLVKEHLKAFAEARASFSVRRYLRLRLVYKYWHMGKTALMPEFYLMLRDILQRKMKKLRLLVLDRTRSG